MSRRPVVFGSYLLFAIAAAMPAQADELPMRKAGMWEMKMIHSGMPETTTRQCTDETVEKELKDILVSPGGKQMCSKQDIRKTATGYAIDAECKVMGMAVTSHTEFVGDFNSAYTMKQTGRAEGGLAGTAGQDTTMAIEAKWLGACKPGWKPGDIEMPGGIKMNVKDLSKLKGLLPK